MPPSLLPVPFRHYRFKEIQSDLLAPPAETEEALEAFCVSFNRANPQLIKALQAKQAPVTWNATITKLDLPETVFCRHRHISVD